jgi:hypothetical protein
MSGRRQQPQQEQGGESGGPIVFAGFSGLNTQASRLGIQDTQCAIMDGFFPAGADNARIIFDHGVPIYVAPAGLHIVFYGFANIGQTPYCIVFLNDGSVVSVNTATLVSGLIALPGKIQNPSVTTVGINQYGSQFILIVSQQPNGYFIWDGTTFFSPGQVIPGLDGPGPIASSTLSVGGSGYEVGDTGIVTGGTGDATYIVTSVGGAPIAIAAINAGGAGYVLNDTGTITTGNGDATYIVTGALAGQVIRITILNFGTGYHSGAGIATATGGAQPGVGVGFTVDLTVNSPVATYTLTAPGTAYISQSGLATATGGAQPGRGTGFSINTTVSGGVVPTGISGTSVEVYSGHVWIVNGDVLEFSAPGSVVDFATSDGGGNLTSNDSSLRAKFTALLATNGYLYLFGDSSIQYIANVQTTGAPPTTTFTIQNSDPETGTVWPGTVDVMGSNIVFANAWGAHVSYGGRTGKISGDLDGIYGSVPNFAGKVPSATKAIVFGRRIWALLLPVIDSFSGQQVNKLFIWDEKRWCSTQQGIDLIYVQHQEIDSVLTAYGTDGNAIYPLFQVPSQAFTKVMRSKFWSMPRGEVFENAVSRLWGVIEYHAAAGVTLHISIDSEYGDSPIDVTPPTPFMTWVNNVGATMVWVNNVLAPMTWRSTGNSIVVFPPQSVAQRGALIGITVSTTAADLGLLSLSALPVPVIGRY